MGVSFPQLRLFDPSGVQLDVSATTAAGSGTYRLTATGLSHQLRICLPSSPAAGFTPTIIGGFPGRAFSLVTSTNVTLPLNEWTVMPPGQFDAFGVFTINNAFDPLELLRVQKRALGDEDLPDDGFCFVCHAADG